MRDPLDPLAIDRFCAESSHHWRLPNRGHNVYRWAAASHGRLLSKIGFVARVSLVLLSAIRK